MSKKNNSLTVIVWKKFRYVETFPHIVLVHLNNSIFLNFPSAWRLASSPSSGLDGTTSSHRPWIRERYSFTDFSTVSIVFLASASCCRSLARDTRISLKTLNGYSETCFLSRLISCIVKHLFSHTEYTRTFLQLLFLILKQVLLVLRYHSQWTNNFWKTATRTLQKSSRILLKSFCCWLGPVSWKLPMVVSVYLIKKNHFIYYKIPWKKKLTSGATITTI